MYKYMYSNNNNSQKANFTFFEFWRFENKICFKNTLEIKLKIHTN